MKLLTSIPARRNGVVSVLLPVSRQNLEFKPDESGALVADVADPADVAALLLLETFEPYDERDFDEARRILGDAVGNTSPEDDDPEGREDDPDDFSETPNGGMPVEANTAPKGDVPPVEGAGAIPAGDAAAPAPAPAPAAPARKPRAPR